MRFNFGRKCPSLCDTSDPWELFWPKKTTEKRILLDRCSDIEIRLNWTRHQTGNFHRFAVQWILLTIVVIGNASLILFLKTSLVRLHTLMNLSSCFLYSFCFSQLHYAACTLYQVFALMKRDSLDWCLGLAIYDSVASWRGKDSFNQTAQHLAIAVVL